MLRSKGFRSLLNLILLWPGIGAPEVPIFQADTKTLLRVLQLAISICWLLSLNTALKRVDGSDLPNLFSKLNCSFLIFFSTDAVISSLPLSVFSFYTYWFPLTSWDLMCLCLTAESHQTAQSHQIYVDSHMTHRNSCPKEVSSVKKFGTPVLLSSPC